MTGFRPGDRVLYRDGDRFAVARVDLVGERHVTGFPFDITRRTWSSRNRRIAAAFVIGKLPPQEHADRVAATINRLTNQREAMRQQANRWLEQSVRELAREAD
jgi:hypothetical protein